MCQPLSLFCSGYVAPWSGRFYSLWDTGYAKIHIPIIASVSEHQPTTWVSFFFDLHILVCVFPAGAWFVIKEINDERVFSESTPLFPNCFVFWVIAAWKSGNVYASAANSRHCVGQSSSCQPPVHLMSVDQHLSEVMWYHYLYICAVSDNHQWHSVGPSKTSSFSIILLFNRGSI